MNVFIIPSWYPSHTNPIYGIFVKEQIEMMARLKPDWKIGVSTWGQGDRRKLLWAKDHFNNLSKLKKHQSDRSKEIHINNISTYYAPALSWTKRFRRGNLNEIIRCNELNYQSFVVKQGKPDIISVQAGYPGVIVASILADKYEIPYHIHLRLGGFMFEYLLSGLGNIKTEFLRSIKKATTITTTSDFQRKSLSKWFQKMEVIHNPVDTTFFKPDAGDSSDLVAIGRLEKEKGFDILIEALKSVGSTKLNILGSGSRSDILIKSSGSLGISDRVQFLGGSGREAVRDYIHQSNFLVLPSKYETFGNVLLEAMACGKPVVATRCGGPQEIVSDRIGILCEPSKEGLAGGIREMMSRRNEFVSTTIRKEIIQRFSPEIWMEKFESLLKDILRK